MIQPWSKPISWWHVKSSRLNITDSTNVSASLLPSDRPEIPHPNHSNGKNIPGNLSSYGGFLSHRGTPSFHPFLDGIIPFTKTIHFLGDPPARWKPPYEAMAAQPKSLLENFITINLKSWATSHLPFPRIPGPDKMSPRPAWCFLIPCIDPFTRDMSAIDHRFHLLLSQLYHESTRKIPWNPLVMFVLK